MQSDPEIKMKLNEIFGEQVFKNGSIAFDRLGSIVFGSIEELKKLNAVVHPPLLERLCFLMRHRREPVVLDAALIPLCISKTGLIRGSGFASFDVRLKRLLAKAVGSRKRLSGRECYCRKSFFNRLRKGSGGTFAMRAALKH